MIPRTPEVGMIISDRHHNLHTRLGVIVRVQETGQFDVHWDWLRYGSKVRYLPESFHSFSVRGKVEQ